MKFSKLALLALVVLTAARTRADNFTTIAVTGATAAVPTGRWAIDTGLSGLGYTDSSSGFPGTTATNFFGITGLPISLTGSPTGYMSYTPTGTATAQPSVGNSMTPTSYAGLTYVAENLSLIGPLSFYSIHHRTTGDYLALIQPSVPTISDQKPMAGPGGPLTISASGYFALSYAADNPGGWGAQLFYYLRTNGLGETVFGSMIPALLSGPTDRWNLGAGHGYTDLAYTSTNVAGGFGGTWVQQFYYLRLDPVTHTTFLGRLDPGTGVATDIKDLGAVYRTLVFTTTNVAYGANLFYTIGQNLTAQTITFPAIAGHTACDAPFTFTLPTATSGLPVTLAVTGPATVSAGNLITLTGATGTVSIQASQAGNGVFSAATNVTQNFAVTACVAPPIAQSISFATIPSHTACDTPFTFTFPTATSGLPVTVTVSGPATLSAGNLVTLTGATGTVSIQASQAGNAFFSAAPNVIQNFAVTACVVPPIAQSISFATIPSHTACDTPFTFTFPTATSGLPVTVTVSGPATLSSGNLVTLTGATGTVSIQASQAGNAFFSAASNVTQSFAVTPCAVLPVAQSISFASIASHTACDTPFTFTFPTATSGLPVTVTVSGPATLSSGNLVTLTGATGTVVIQASQAGNSLFLAAPSVSQSFVVAACAPAPAPQTISFAPISNHTACDSPFTFAFPTATSGLPVTVVASGPVTVSAGNLISPTGGTGTVTLQATQAGNASFLAAPAVTQTFVVAACPAPPVVTSPHDVQLGGQPLTPNVVTGTVGTVFVPYQIAASGSPTSFGALLLPPGLSVNSATGLITGTPTVANTWFVTLQANNIGGTGTATLIVVIAPAGVPPVITSLHDVQSPAGQPLTPNVLAGTVGAPFTPYQIVATGSPTSYGALLLPPGLSLNSATGAITGTPTAANTWFVTIQAVNAAGTGAETLIIVIAPAAVAPIIASAATLSGTVGTPITTYVITATGLPTSYGATGLPPGLTLNSTTGAIDGTPTAAGTSVVTLAATNTTGTATSLLTVVIAPQAVVASSRIVNFSARALVGSGSQTLNMGFVVSGPSKSLLVRAVGPTLANYGVPNALLDPMLTLYGPAGVIASNDDWQINTAGPANGPLIAATAAQFGAFALPAGSKDSALLATVAGGLYTTSVVGANGSGGVALSEIYDTDLVSGSRLINVSARMNVLPGANSAIIGLVIAGNAPKTVLIRGVGPALAPFGVVGVLADPIIAVFSGSTQIAANDNWETGTNSAAQIVIASAQVGAFPLPPGNKDAALLLTLQPGSYTVQLAGVGNTAGVALIEIYDTQ